MARRGIVGILGLTAATLGLALLGPLGALPTASPAVRASASTAIAPATATPLVVVATTSVIGDLVAQVAGDAASVTVLVGPGREPHDFAPTPADAATIAAADVLFANGLGLETWLDALIQSAASPSLRRVTLSTGLPVIDQDPHDPTSGNPHLWLDPTLASAYVTTIRDTLSDLDPAHQPVYATNAARYLSRLHDLDAAIALEFAAIPTERRLLVTFHDAWSYFAQRYGLRHVSIHPANPEGEVSAQAYAALVDTLRREQARVIFGEAGFNPKTLRQLATDTGVRFVDGLHGDTLAADGPAATYLGMVRHDASLIVDALR